MAVIRLTPATAVPAASISVSFVRSAGPGGQNVNKVSSAVELRFDLDAADLPPPVRARLERIVGSKLTQGGEVIIFAQRFRTQKANRDDALARLAEFVERAERQPKRRVATRPTLSSKRRRRETKGLRGSIKKLRGRPAADD
jgi:ribosome-associated protein